MPICPNNEGIHGQRKVGNPWCNSFNCYPCTVLVSRVLYANVFLLGNDIRIHVFGKKRYVVKNVHQLLLWPGFSYLRNSVCLISSVANPKLFWGGKKWGGECLTLGEQQYFCLGRRFSKHKMTKCAKNFGGHGPLGPSGYAYMLKGSHMDAHVIHYLTVVHLFNCRLFWT